MEKDWRWEDAGEGWVKKTYNSDDKKLDPAAVSFATLLKCSEEVIRCKRDPYLNLPQALRDLEAAIYACKNTPYPVDENTTTK